jgi:hypothetical protein
MSKNTQFAQLNECASYMLIFVQRIRAFFPAGTSNMRIKSHLAFQRDERQLFVPESRQIWSTVIHSTFLGLKPLRIVCYAARIPSRPQADPLYGSQAKVSELHRFPYNSIARAESSKSSFLPKFE